MLTTLVITALLLGPSAEEPAASTAHESVAFDPADVMERASGLWQEGKDAEVVALFEEAYTRDPRPEYLFGKGRALAALGECDDALAAFEAFVATEPPQEQRTAAEAEMDKCAPQAEPAAPAATPPPATATPAVTEPPPQPRLEPASTNGPDQASGAVRYRWPIGLSVAGVVVAAAGGTTLGIGLGRARGNQSGVDEDAYARSIRRGRALTTVGATLLSTGGALVLAAVVDALVIRRRGRTSSGPASRRASVPTSRGLGVVRF